MRSTVTVNIRNDLFTPIGGKTQPREKKLCQATLNKSLFFFFNPAKQLK